MNAINNLESNDLKGKIDKYKIIEKIGEGGMGQVYKAYDIFFEKEIALKVIKPDTIDPVVRRRFLREARAMSMLEHPNILKVYDIRQEKNLLFITMPLIRGGSLKEKMGQGISVLEAVKYMIEIGKGVYHAHTKGIIHRDLKPGNIMIDEDGRPVVSDFGLAKVTNVDKSTQLTATGAIVGTYRYMSPEQAYQPEKVDHLSDQYSLGAILYQMITGRTMFSGNSMHIIYQLCEEEPPPPCEINPNIPKELEYICLKAVAKEKKNRFANTQEMVNALIKFCQGSSTNDFSKSLVFTEDNPINSEVQTKKHPSRQSHKRLKRLSRTTEKSPFGVTNIVFLCVTIFITLFLVMGKGHSNAQKNRQKSQNRNPKLVNHNPKTIDESPKTIDQPIPQEANQDVEKNLPLDRVLAIKEESYKLKDPLWSFPNPKNFEKIVYTEDAAYLANHQGVYAVDLENGNQQWFFDNTTTVTHSISVTENFVYVLTDHHTKRLATIKRSSGEGTFEYAQDVLLMDHGNIYRQEGNKLKVLDLETKKEIWHHSIEKKIEQIYYNKNLTYIIDDFLHIYKDTNGKKLAKFPVQGRVYCLNSYKRIVCGFINKHLCTYDMLQNKLLWALPIEGCHEKTIVTPKMIYASVEEKIGRDYTYYVRAYDVKDGSQKWEIHIPWIARNLRYTPSGLLFYCQNKIYILDHETGARKWEFSISESTDVHCRKVIIKKDKVYLTTSALNFTKDVQKGVSAFYAIDRKSNRVEWISQTDFPNFEFSDQIEIREDTIYVLGANFLHALPRNISPKTDPEKFVKVTPNLKKGVYAEISFRSLPFKIRGPIKNPGPPMDGVYYDGWLKFGRNGCFMQTTFELPKVPEKLGLHLHHLAASSGAINTTPINIYINDKLAIGNFIVCLDGKHYNFFPITSYVKEGSNKLVIQLGDQAKVAYWLREIYLIAY